MGDWSNTLIAIVVAIIGLATLSVILSKQANTVGVIQAGSQGLSSLINAAVAPVSGFGGLSTGIQPLTNYSTLGSTTL